LQFVWNYEQTAQFGFIGEHAQILLLQLGLSGPELPVVMPQIHLNLSYVAIVKKQYKIGFVLRKCKKNYLLFFYGELYLSLLFVLSQGLMAGDKKERDKGNEKDGDDQSQSVSCHQKGMREREREREKERERERERKGG
jgi:hypothetical protein